MKMLSVMLALISVLMLGCDAQVAQWTSIGDPAVVTCYSGGQVVGKWLSTGKVVSEERSDGWYFVDSVSKKLIRVSADCVIEN